MVTQLFTKKRIGALVCAATAMTAAAVDSAAWNPTDDALSTEIHGIFSRNQNVDTQKMEIVTKDGVVSLTGTVSNTFARDQAARIVAEVKGVRSVVNRLTIEGAPRSDEDLQRDVEWLLRIDPATSNLKVTPMVSQGVVTLTGTVGSRRTADLVRIIASDVAGLRGVNESLTIQPGADGPKLSEEEMRRQIERRLVANQDVDARGLNVEVKEGAVMLTGVVGSAAEKRIAGSLAWVDDVTSVDTENVMVDPMFDRNASAVTAELTNDALREDIQLALLYEPRVDAFDITVRVEGGVAFLSGTVDNLMARQAAARVAGSTRGVYRVENAIVVRAPEPIEALTIAENFKRNLALDPLLSSEDVDIVMDGSKAVLTGEVNTSYERERAAWIASRQRGIDHIENRITLADAPALSDEELLAAILNELTWSPYVDADDITVAVEDGVATLSGDVATWSEHKAAIENAYEGGARRVVSKMLVAGGPPQHVPYEDGVYERRYVEY